MDNFEKVCACAIARYFTYEPRIAKGIIDALGSARALFELDREALQELTGPFSRLKGLLTEEQLRESERILAGLAECGADFVPIGSEDYPPLLRECDDAPVGLYVRSCRPLREVLGSRQAVSVVGTRDLSSYGLEWTEKIVRALSHTYSRPVIVSGFAIGVDIAAHLEALHSGLGTVAVLPTGIDMVYPSRHSAIARRLAAEPGCALVSDFHPGTAVAKVNFLQRNRIIAGLSCGTVLVESKVKGGGMMTARLANGYGRTVLALPGRIDDLRSGGCNYLLKTKLAEPLTDLDGLSEQLGLGKWRRSRRTDLAAELQSVFGKSQSGETMTLLQRCAFLIKDRRDLSIDELGLALNTEIPVSDASVAFLTGMLEAEGFISIDLAGRCRLLK